jgi:hypothetical protein
LLAIKPSLAATLLAIGLAAADRFSVADRIAILPQHDLDARRSG